MAFAANIKQLLMEVVLRVILSGFGVAGALVIAVFGFGIAGPLDTNATPHAKTADGGYVGLDQTNVCGSCGNHLEGPSLGALKRDW